jgi:hypothetical protein
MEGANMKASILARVLVGLTFAAGPAFAAGDQNCERALAKASTKFVGAAFKTAQRCAAAKAAGRLPDDACNLMAATTGSRRVDAALGHAETNLRRGLGPCSDATLSQMGFASVCSGAGGEASDRAGVQACIAHTHMAAVQALVSVEFPRQSSNCGNGVIDADEDCDPVANPPGCDVGETCGAAGSADECTCVTSGTCGNGTQDAGEACDPAATPTGCPAGMTCQADCTCSNGAGNQCEGSCAPTCASGQSCVCSCAGGAMCGNGTRDAGEECDPMANPSGCATGMICGAPGTAQQCTCYASAGGTCGNGMLDPGEGCDPALPNNCDPGEVCLATGPMACTCGAPPSNCGNGMIEWGEQCDPAANPTGCPTGQTCGARGSANPCSCSSGSPGGAFCGNGTVDAGEQCDPAASPTGCAAGQTCSGQCTCSGGGGATCGNGTIDAGEQCDPTANPTGCPAGTTCSASCTCGGGGGGGGATLSFTTALGTANCGGGGLASPPAPPASGEIDSDTAGSSKISDLGLGCLYFGGGSGTIVPPGRIPDGATSVLSVSGSTLSASAGSGRNDCTNGAGPSKKCANDNAEPSCSSDADCGGSAGSCAPVANCFFGPPLPILSPPPSDALTTCIMNVVQSDAGGTVDTASGASSVSLPLTSRVYITGNTASPCPTCAGGACSYGKNPGASCTATGSLGTSNDCPPDFAGFQAPLPVNLTPLTSGTAAKTAADGKFCPGQTHAGAFGKAAAKRVAETGAPAGALTDGAGHPSILAAAFCIPKTGNIAVDGVADLPGPGAIGLNGTAQLHQ